MKQDGSVLKNNKTLAPNYRSPQPPTPTHPRLPYPYSLYFINQEIGIFVNLFEYFITRIILSSNYIIPDYFLNQNYYIFKIYYMTKYKIRYLLLDTK